jgi:hypothetical protein
VYSVLLMALVFAESAVAVPVPGRAPGSRGLVVVLVPPISDDVMRNALARVQGELAAAPFETVTAPIDAHSDVMAEVETAGAEQAATAAFAIVRDRDPGSGRVTIWVSNRVSRTTTMQRMQIEDGDVDRAAARLAIETVELVRASLAELWPQPRVTPPAADISQVPRAPNRSRVALALSVGLLRAFGDAPDFWAPQIAASYGRKGGIAARLSASGLGPGAGVSTTTGSARIQRAIATFGLVRSFRPDRVVQPSFGIAAGIHHISVTGMLAAMPELARDAGAFSALATASAGVALAVSSRLAVLVETEILMFWPAQTVRIYDTDVATFDRPNLFVHAGLLAAF